MFDVRQAARGAIAPSRPHVGSFADCSTAQRNRPAIRLDGGARVRRAAVNAAIVHGCLNGTYYLITYDGFLARALSLAHGVPAAARAPRRATACLRNSTERGARAPRNEREAVQYKPELRRDAESKLRRGGCS